MVCAFTRSLGRGLITASAAISLVAVSCGCALAQACPSPVVVSNTQCTVPTTAVINVTPAGATGLAASGASGAITANGVTLNLAAGSTVTTTTGALAQSGSTIDFNGSTLKTTSTTTATSANHLGLRATGAGSTINAIGSSVTLGPPNGTTTANNMTGVAADTGGSLVLQGTDVSMLGGAAGLNNNALVATGTGSQISYSNGAITTKSRTSFGALAQGGGSVILNGATVTTTGAGTAVIAGSHALFATGAGSQISGSNDTINVSGQQASGVRAESGGTVSLSNSSMTSTSTAAADTDPSSAARALSGGVLQLTGVTINASGQRGHGFSVQDAGSLATITGSDITASGARASGAFIFNGGRATVSDSNISGTSTASGGNAVLVQDAGSSISITNSALRSTSPVGFGLRVNSGGSATMTGGSSTTEGRDASALFVAGGTVTAINAAVTTLGNDNSIGALADLNGQLTLNGGSVTTHGDAVRLSSFPHALAARNPGAILMATGTTIITTGATAMGAVADDGGTVILSGNAITTHGEKSIGLFAVTEQVGAQFPANLTATSITLETFGLNAHGVTAQARNDAPVEKALATINASSVTTHGDGAAGLRAVLGDYGARPITGRGEAAVVANSSTVLTEGVSAYGALSRDNPTSVTMNQTSVLTTGLFGHGSVADAGGLIVGNNSSITAQGGNAAAFYAVGTPAAVSTGLFTNTNLLNTSGPTIGVAGSGNVSLTNSFAGGSSEWLRVGTSANFPPPTAVELPIFGVPDPDAPDTPPPFTLPPPTVSAPTPGLANVTLTHSTVVGAATTLPGSVSNVTLLDNSIWIMTGNSNVTNLVNDPSLIQFTPPVGDPTPLSSYKTLTTVNYLGLGGVIGLNTFLGSDPSPSDRLVIDSGNAGGFSPLRIANTTGKGDLTHGNGILVVDTINAGTTVPGTFTLAAPVVAGPYEYGLFRSSVDASNPDAWYLRSTLDCTLDPTNPACQPNPPVPPPHFRVETSLYAAVPSMALLYGRTLLDTLHERVGEEEDQRWWPDPENGKLGWGRIIGVSGHQSGDVIGVLGSGPSYNYTFLGLQAGMDVYRHDRPDGSRDQAGAYFAIGGDQGRVTHIDSSQGNSNFNAYTLGGYWTHFGTSGWYTDAILQGTFYDINSSADRGLPALRTGAQGAAASIEAGYPFKFSGGYFIEPQAQIVYQNIHINDSSDVAAQIRFSNVDSLAARIGARFGRTWTLDGSLQTITAWIRPNLWNEFLGSPITSFSSESGLVPFHADLRGLWGEINVGVSGQVTASTTLYANASYSSRFDSGGFAYTGKAGVRVSW